MTRRTTWMVLLLAALPARALAEGTSLSNSLTLFSNPPGVSFRISGDQEIVGRTPITFSPWLPGRYRIEGSEAGYDRWRRSLVFDSASSDTIWITLRRKNVAMAGVRALAVPGWGQWYDEHPRRGLVFLAGAVAAGIGTAVANMRYQDRWDENRAAASAYMADPTPATAAAWQRSADRVGDAQLVRAGFIWAGVGVWGLGLIDAVAFVPRPLRSGLRGGGGATGGTSGREPRGGGADITMTLARVRF